MLKRAGVSFVVAIVAALWGFSGVLQVTAPFGRFLCFIAAGFGLLSLMLSLFECPTHTEPEPGLHVSTSHVSASPERVVISPLIVTVRGH